MTLKACHSPVFFFYNQSHKPLPSVNLMRAGPNPFKVVSYFTYVSTLVSFGVRLEMFYLHLLLPNSSVLGENDRQLNASLRFSPLHSAHVLQVFGERSIWQAQKGSRTQSQH